MSKDINNLELPLQKVLELGEIDRRLRDIARMVPNPADSAARFSPERDLHTAAIEVQTLDINTHVIAFGTHDLIENADIEKMVGFRQLINACSKANVRVDLALLGGALEICFEPDEAFSRSRVFGASYTNVLPAMFGLRSGK